MECLAYLKENNVLHRDISANNVLYDPEDKAIYLLDFGFAVVMKNEEDRRLSGKVGTRGFKAPEISSLGMFMFVKTKKLIS